MAEKVPPLTERIEQILKRQKELSTKKSANQDNCKKTKLPTSSAQSSFSKCQDDIFSDTNNRSVCKFKTLSVKLGAETECGKSKEKTELNEYDNHKHLSNPGDVCSTNVSKLENSVIQSDNNFNCLRIMSEEKKDNEQDVLLDTDTKLDAHILPESKHLDGNMGGESKKDYNPPVTTALPEIGAKICDPSSKQTNSIGSDNKSIKSKERRKVVVHANSSDLIEAPLKKQNDIIQHTSTVEKKAVGKKRRRGFLIGDNCESRTSQKNKEPVVKDETVEVDKATPSLEETKEELCNNMESVDEVSEDINTGSYDKLQQKSRIIDSKVDESNSLQLTEERKLSPSKEVGNVQDNIQTELSAIDNFVSTCVEEEHRDSLENIHIQFEDSESPSQGKKSLNSQCENSGDNIKSNVPNNIAMKFDESPGPEEQIECKDVTGDIKSHQADDLKIQFDDSESLSIKKSSCQTDEKNASLISKDSIGESFTSPKTKTPPLKRKVKRAKRRSSDFQIISAAITLSPLQSPSEPDKNLMFSGPTYRRSRRLKRKSIEIYRTSKYNSDLENAEETSIERDESKQEEIETVGDIAEVKLPESKSVAEDKSVPANDASDTVKNEQRSHLDGDKEVLNTKLKQEILDSVGEVEEKPHELLQEKPQELQQETLQEKPRPKRKAAQGINYISELVDNYEENNSSSNKITNKGKRGKRAKTEPTVEEIYHNKLWRSQMPKDKSWETIFETPQVSKMGTEEHQSSKKFKRHVNFDDFYTNIRLKKRRQKAIQRGWKPLTKKRQETAGKLLFEKLTALQDILDIQSEIKAEVNVAVNTDEEKSLTPVKDINELARFKDGQILVSPKSVDKDIAEEGDDDVFEMPVQSDLPAPNLTVSASNQSSNDVLDSKVTSKNSSLQSNPDCDSHLAFSPQY